MRLGGSGTRAGYRSTAATATPTGSWQQVGWGGFSVVRVRRFEVGWMGDMGAGRVRRGLRGCTAETCCPINNVKISAAEAVPEPALQLRVCCMCFY